MAQAQTTTISRIAAPTGWRSPLRGIFRFMRRYPLGAVGGVLILLLVVLAIFAPLIATHDRFALSSRERRQAPSAEHYFGTDELGRDIFSRVVYGARISLQVGFISVGLGVTIGSLIGMLGAYFRGTVDFWLQRLVDSLFAFPTIILALTIVAVLGASTTNVIVAVGIVSIPRISRVVRSAALSVMAQPYIEAARSMGARDRRIVMQHILPNVAA